MKILHEGKNTAYLSQQCIREGYAFSNLKGAMEKRGKKGIHSTYGMVSEYSTEVCGVYISADRFKNGSKTATVEMKSLIPISDLLPFQAFSMYPANIVGALAIKVLFSTAAFVWCQVPPEVVLEANNYMNYGVDALNADFKALSTYDRFFHQIGDPGYVYDYVTNAYARVKSHLLYNPLVPHSSGLIQWALE